MRKHSIIGKITFGLGLIFFIFGCVALLGLSDDSSIIVANKSIAFAYLPLGISLILTSFLYTKKNNK
ncbi:hypothetical protein [Bacillus alveayuensis]|jgi:hypothetical protein|uniref:hypothetical protein n=1 Tax=Aeribacillus alveayuensis TaxID=279215 RepID=UPI0005CD443F|nr:hypothetical protein [Bacillus alveayuensis]